MWQALQVRDKAVADSDAAVKSRSICELPGITSGRFVSMCGQIGVMMNASRLGSTIGPPAARE